MLVHRRAFLTARQVPQDTGTIPDIRQSGCAPTHNTRTSHERATPRIRPNMHSPTIMSLPAYGTRPVYSPDDADCERRPLPPPDDDPTLPATEGPLSYLHFYSLPNPRSTDTHNGPQRLSDSHMALILGVFCCIIVIGLAACIYVSFIAATQGCWKRL